ncbi:MAG: hypothetical protein WA888_13255 [Burkholderiaceae bacterium]
MRATTAWGKTYREPRQLPMALDGLPLQAMSDSQRQRAILQLARILLLAAGAGLKERDDDGEH